MKKSFGFTKQYSTNYWSLFQLEFCVTVTVREKGGGKSFDTKFLGNKKYNLLILFPITLI